MMALFSFTGTPEPGGNGGPPYKNNGDDLWKIFQKNS